MKKLVLVIAMAVLWIAVAAHTYRLAVSLNRFALNTLVFATSGVLIVAIFAPLFTGQLRREVLRLGMLRGWRYRALRRGARMSVYAAAAVVAVAYAALQYGHIARIGGAGHVVVERDGQRRILDGPEWNLRDRIVVFAPERISLDENQVFPLERREAGVLVRGELRQLAIVIPRDEARLLRADNVDNLTMRASFERVMDGVQVRAAQRAIEIAACGGRTAKRHGFDESLRFEAGPVDAYLAAGVGIKTVAPCDAPMTIAWGDQPLDPMLDRLGARVELAEVRITSVYPRPVVTAAR